MDKNLNLKMVEAYTVHSQDDERRSSDKGIYTTWESANKKTKGSGWWGSDGRVIEKIVYVDSEGEVYEVKKLGKFTDLSEEYNLKMSEAIKSKLSKEEIEFLNSGRLK